MLNKRTMFSTIYVHWILIQIFNIALKSSAALLHMNDVGMNDSKVIGTIMKNITDIGFIMCARKCEATSSCQAVNFHKSFLLCELISHSLKEHKSSEGWIAAKNVTWLKSYKLSTGLEQKECPAFFQKTKLKSGIMHCSKQNFPADCHDKLINKDGANNGVYRISPQENSVFDVFCDYESDGGPWTVIQARVDGSVDFYRPWNDYKVGFGNLYGSFWLGNDNMHNLLSTGSYMLKVDMEYFDSTKWYARYNKFHVAGEDDKYRLTVAGYSGTAGDSLGNSMAFSTIDSDNDNNVNKSCAIDHKGGWWFGWCYTAFLNGIYYNKSILLGAEITTGIHWFSVKDGVYSMKNVCMKTNDLDI